MVRLLLPYPPSVNALKTPIGRGRAISSATYRHWKQEAGYALLTQHPHKQAGRVSVTVALCPPDKRLRDLDNVGFKAVLDLLVEHGVIEGDDGRYVREIKARWADEGHPCVVIVEPIPDEAAFERAVAKGMFAGLNAPKEVVE